MVQQKKSTRNTKLVPIKYTSREFDSIKRDLVEYAKRYYPETFKDFNEAGFGSLFLDTVAYVGDILSFYLDFQANESFLDTALEYDNVIKLGRQMGYKFKGNPSSFGFVTIYILVPVSPSGIGPDTRYMPILKRGSLFKSTSNTGFILEENIDFSRSENEIVVAQSDDTTGLPTTYAVKAVGKVISGEIVQDIIDVSTFEKFLRIKLSSPNFAEVISVRDTEGHVYYEVDTLSQNVIYKPIVNRNSATDNVKSILRPFVVPRRFVVEQDERRRAFLQFGYGSESQLTTEAVADPRNVVLQENGKNYITDPSFDPTKLIESDKFGIAPANTKLTVVYRTNTTANVNVAAGRLVSVSKPLFEFKNLSLLNANTVRFVGKSIEINNEDPITGDVSYPSTEELKRKILDHYSTQNRAVTKNDYISTIYSMPPQFGAIKRASIEKDDDSFKRNLNVYVISENVDGTLVTTNSIIKNNVKTWLNKNRMINDTIDILNARILNVTIDFTIIVDLEFNKFDVLVSAVGVLREKLSTPRDIGEAFYISDIYKILNNVNGVLDVQRVTVKQRTGANYADLDFNIEENTSPDGRYFVVPEDVIVEVKFPLQDIQGVIK